MFRPTAPRSAAAPPTISTHDGMPVAAEASIGGRPVSQSDAAGAASNQESWPVSPGSPSRAQQLLKQCARKRICSDNIGKLDASAINALADALGCADANANLNQKRSDVAEILSKAVGHAGNSRESPYTNLTARALRSYFPTIDEADVEALEKAMATAHISIGIDQMDPDHPMAISFDGTQNFTDWVEDIKTATGAHTGAVYQATAKAAEIFAKLLADPASEARLDLLTGFSMGGGTAQFFKAALESRIDLPKKPALVVFDPQLLHDGQKREAVQGGTREYKFDEVQGLAITLDYDKNPRTPLMRHMKNRGYPADGLLELELPLKPWGRENRSVVDGRERVSFELTEPSGTLLGYHKNFALFEDAIGNFLAEKRFPPTPPPAPPPSLAGGD